ncbi:MAG: LapA family protein [Deltaproteobacteria bacterium]|nr:LapA family protein [Deltaproteobacteria bacterium]
MRAVLLLIIVLLAVVAAFAVQNPGIIDVRFLHLSGSTSLLVVIVLAFGIGVLVGFLGCVPSSIRRARRIRELSAELDSLRKPSGAPPPPVNP